MLYALSGSRVYYPWLNPPSDHDGGMSELSVVVYRDGVHLLSFRHHIIRLNVITGLKYFLYLFCEPL
jgi:hypothetical protein